MISARPYGQRAVLKFGQYTGSNYMAGRYTPGTFTNQVEKQFQEPRLLIITDPRTDSQVSCFKIRCNMVVIFVKVVDVFLCYARMILQPDTRRLKQIHYVHDKEGLSDRSGLQGDRCNQISFAITVFFRECSLSLCDISPFVS